jgi:ParB/RepB/Spo0J family partition protein
MDLEFHQLDLHYEGLRSRCPARERRLLASLAEVGQQVPIVVVESGESDRHVVIDGYKRVRALRRLGQDTVRALLWQLGEADALVVDRLMRVGPIETALEQGWLLEELHGRFGLSLEELARRFDRSLSWVSGRLGLVRELPEPIQQRVREGEIAAHAAMKYLLPVARGNQRNALRFAAAIAGKKLTTRQVAALYRGYRSGSAKTRELVLSDPLVFLRAREEARESNKPTPDDPAGQLLRDFDMLGAIARRALRRLCEGTAVRLAPSEWDDVERCFAQARRDVERVARQLDKETSDAGSGTADGDSRAAPAGARQATDRPGVGDFSSHGAPGDRLGLDGGAPAGASFAGRDTPGEDSRAVRELRGQRGAGA